MRKAVSLACTILLSTTSSLSAALAFPQRLSTLEPLVLANTQGQAKSEHKPDFKPQMPNQSNMAPKETTDKSIGAEALIKELQKLTDVQQTPQDAEKIKRLEKEGQKLFDQKLFGQALAVWQEGYGLCLDTKNSEGQGRALTNMAKVYIEQGQWIKAKHLGENAIEVLTGGGNEVVLAQARIVLAQAYFGLDNPVWATQQLDAALRSLSSGQLNDPDEGSRLMYLCANLAVKSGKVKEAIKFYQQGAQYSYDKGDIGKAVQVRATIVNSMIDLGWFVAALEEANKLLSVAKAAPKDSNVYQVTGYQCIGNAHFAAGEFANARRAYETVYALISKIDARQIPDVSRANIDEGYGFVLCACGDYEQGRQMLLKAASVLKAKQDNQGLAQIYNALGVIEVQDGQTGKGLGYFQQGLDYHAVLQPVLPRLHAITMQNMACAEYRTGSFRDAKNHLTGAITIMGKNPDVLLKGRILQGVAEVCLKSSDLTNAESYVQKAIAGSEKLGDDANLWRSYTVLAKLQLTRGEVEPAKASLNSALSYFRSPQAADFASADQLGYPCTREDMGALLVQLLASQGMTEQALVTAEQIKEENFILEWTRRGGEVKREDRDVYNELVTQRARLHSAELVTTPDKLLKEWKSWMERFTGVVKTNRSLARLIAPVPTMAPEIIASLQKNNATAVDYLVGPEFTMAFTIEPSGRMSSSCLPVGKARLKSQVTSLLVSAAQAGGGAGSGDADRVVLHSLYSELLPAAVRQFLPKNAEQVLVVIPDGPLYNLPFAALIDDQGKFLVEKHLLTMISSVSVLLDSQPRIADDLSVIMANSNGSQGSEKAETDQIASVVGTERVTTLFGKEAAINNLEEQSRGKSVVHFSSRLPLLESNPLRSVLPILSDSTAEGAQSKVTVDKLCGTKMASDLIVWSASSVNSKDVRGNAVKVFSRGLNYAGARNVLMSLWSQPESERIDELVNFYKSKQSGLGPAQSLRKAQLAALSRDRAPRTWAAFQLLGPGN
ncbi:MAG: CHAT domain-containing protein [Candidatus Melainabacteria bacterium]|nr:CHAT domain-containing protein [Candidatus Melainabacteria bacterium]